MRTKQILTVLILLTSFLLSSCSALAKKPALTAWPKYASVGLPNLGLEGIHPPTANSCSIYALDLIGAWVNAKSPEKDSFSFTDGNGKACQGTFDADVLPLFTTANLWYAGAPSCRTCHGPDVAVSYARLDLSSYQGIMAGMARESEKSKGDDILGGGNWEKSELYNVLNNGLMPPKRPAGVGPKGPLLAAGSSQ
jgi:hypothetical protein